MLHNIAVCSDQCRAGSPASPSTRQSGQRRRSLRLRCRRPPLEADEFYTAHGCTVGPVATPLCIKLGDQLMVFQLKQTQSHWFINIAERPEQRGLSVLG